MRLRTSANPKVIAWLSEELFIDYTVGRAVQTVTTKGKSPTLGLE